MVILFLLLLVVMGTDTVKSVYKDHHGDDHKVIFRGRWSLFTGEIVLQNDGTKRCFECSDVPHPADCKVVTFCPDSNLCMTRQYVSSGGQILYSSGCESKFRCTAVGKRYIQSLQRAVRANSDIIVCEECCKGDFCNFNGCGVSTPMQPQRGPFCLSCPDEDDPVNCRHVTQCELGETCSVRQIIDHNADGVVRFQSGCIRDIQCAGLSLTAKTHNICFECCVKDFCNDKCNATIHRL